PSLQKGCPGRYPPAGGTPVPPRQGRGAARTATTSPRRRVGRRRRGSLGLRLPGPGHRQGEGERRAGPYFALHRDPAAVRFDDPLGEGEAEACARALGPARLPELVEHVVELTLRDPRPCVADPEPHLVPFPRRADGDSSFLCELDRIADQVAEELED